MINGNSYGNGIYLSNSFQTSRNYSLKGINTGFIVGVFLVADNIEKYKKAEDVYVINDIKKIQLKYILWNSNNTLHSEGIQQITNKFGKTIVIEKIQENNYFTGLKNKRLMREIQYVMSGKSEAFGLKFDIDEQNMFIWKVYISKIDESSELYKDMKKMNIEHIQMEIRFENNFPLKVPFVRVISPIFKFRSGRICQGGSICSEVLTNSGWSPSYNVESLFIQIKSDILEGEGRLEFNKPGYKYTLKEAQTSYKRMLLSHGWK